MTMTKAAALTLFGLGIPLSGQSIAVQDVAAGQQLYRGNCFACHGQDGDSIQGVNLRGGQFRRASSDDELSRLIASGIPGTGMPPTNLSEPQRRALVAYVRSMHNNSAVSALTGDAERGSALFRGKGGCTSCHRVGAKGSPKPVRVRAISSSRSRRPFRRSILDPNGASPCLKQCMRASHAQQCAVITGRRLNEDTHTIQLIDQTERLVSLSKSDLREYTILKSSPMPSYQGKLSSQEIADLISYLLSLRGSQ